jgi:signal transduction histidine kinase
MQELWEYLNAQEVSLMAGQTIGFPDNQGDAYPVTMFSPRSNAHHVSVDPSFDEANGANRHGMEVEIDRHPCTQERRCNTCLRFNRLSRFATVAELSASIAHQLSQPLTSMLANAQAAKRWLAAVPPNLMEATVSIDRIVRDARTADETMQRIQALFKQEPLDRRAANIPDVISAAVRLVLEDPRKREVSIRCCFGENLPEVWADPLAIQELFINLISNAIEALENNGESALVTIHAAVNDANEMIIQVIDNGSGIGETDEIFDAFVTSKKSGLGIGLALSRSIAEAHGGRLWAENNPSGGATFSLTLPLSFRNEISAGG